MHCVRRLYYGLVGLLELVKFTPLIGALQGTVGPWSIVINVLLGVNAAGSYARIDRLPGKRKVGAVAVAVAVGSASCCGCLLRLSPC